MAPLFSGSVVLAWCQVLLRWTGYPISFGMFWGYGGFGFSIVDYDEIMQWSDERLLKQARIALHWLVWSQTSGSPMYGEMPSGASHRLQLVV